MPVMSASSRGVLGPLSISAFHMSARCFPAKLAALSAAWWLVAGSDRRDSGRSNESVSWLMLDIPPPPAFLFYRLCIRHRRRDWGREWPEVDAADHWKRDTAELAVRVLVVNLDAEAFVVLDEGEGDHAYFPHRSHFLIHCPG
jgi:hypothetical protein